MHPQQDPPVQSTEQTIPFPLQPDRTIKDLNYKSCQSSPSHQIPYRSLNHTISWKISSDPDAETQHNKANMTVTVVKRGKGNPSAYANPKYSLPAVIAVYRRCLRIS